jgi:hypothetical protein
MISQTTEGFEGPRREILSTNESGGSMLPPHMDLGDMLVLRKFARARITDRGNMEVIHHLPPLADFNGSINQEEYKKLEGVFRLHSPLENNLRIRRNPSEEDSLRKQGMTFEAAPSSYIRLLIDYYYEQLELLLKDFNYSYITQESYIHFHGIIIRDLERLECEISKREVYFAENPDTLIMNGYSPVDVSDITYKDQLKGIGDVYQFFLDRASDQELYANGQTCQSGSQKPEGDTSQYIYFDVSERLERLSKTILN